MDMNLAFPSEYLTAADLQGRTHSLVMKKRTDKRISTGIGSYQKA